MAVMDSIIEKARGSRKRLVFPEGQDPRVVTAAQKVVHEDLAAVTVLGSEEEIKESCRKAQISRPAFDILDHSHSDRREEYAAAYAKLRRKKDAGKDPDTCKENYKTLMGVSLYYANMMTRQNDADGLVAGSIASTQDMLRAAFKVVGTAPGIETASSCFLMDLKEPSPAGYSSLLFADCGVNPDPDADALRDIALATAKTYTSLLGERPKIAFLSFSTKGSASHRILDKMIDAAEKTRATVYEKGLPVDVDGELQADAALVPAVAQKKCCSSVLEGQANILIFPDLNAGNISYKLTQRLAGADAYGPILQGLAQPVNDLSRGCSADDIFGVAAITVCQALHSS
ncbi:MAG: phosphotransacetylase [Fibrobacterota bacterium]